MTARTLRVCIDRLVLRNVDDSGIGDLPGLVSERLPSSAEDLNPKRPIPRSGQGMRAAAVERIVHEVRTRFGKP